MPTPWSARILRGGLPLCSGLFAAVIALACDPSDGVDIPDVIELGAIRVNDESRLVERGSRDTLTATTVDRSGDTVDVPVVWQSSNEQVAIFERGGVLVALDTGLTVVTATSLGVRSEPVAFRVVWFGPAFIDTVNWTRPHALMPGATLSDSLRVRVINVDSVPVRNAVVRFTVTGGGGSVSPVVATTGPNGVAATQWTLGPDVGLNSVEASVVRHDSVTSDTLVQQNAASFSITSYHALTVESGDNQTGQILSELPEQPAVVLVDSLGNPRPGVPVQFTAFFHGRVTTPVVSTNSNGVATPGAWTLGDIPGEQRLEARVGDAVVNLHATATGTPVYYTPALVVAGGISTCALESGGEVKCWGEDPQIGTGDTTNVSTPTPVAGTLSATSLAGYPSHYCALTAEGSAWCWGVNALMDTSGTRFNEPAPAKLPSDIVWSQLSPGFSHNCGLSVTQVAYCWGNNASGQLGDGTTTSRFRPTPVTGGFTFSQIANGTSHTCALSDAGSAFCWGLNQFGQLGDASTTNRNAPTGVGGGHTFQSIGAGDIFSCGLSTAGKAVCWGTISGTPETTPIVYDDAPTFVSLAVGGGHACALTADNEAYCWGANNWGQLGDSTMTRRNDPTRVAGDLRFSQISAGLLHTCARTTESQVACWGQNRSGELGDSTAAFHVTPRRIVLGVTP